MQLTRREILKAGLVAAATARGSFWVNESRAATPSRYRDVFADLDRFVAQYMRDMNAPAMTLVLADREGVQRVATYGTGDLERQRELQADELFQIGSITKSFVAMVLLQLREEGKLDLHKPITDYLPSFRIQSKFAPITTHHLLTHTSGLPGEVGAVEPFPSDPRERHIAAYAPGERFYYNNMAYVLLGYLAWTLDGRELPDLLRERIFKPLGMSQSEPAIDFQMRGRLAKSYRPLLNDRPFPRRGELCEAPLIIETGGAGCIAATARDMGAYVQMIANRGRGPHGDLISPEAFDLFSRRHVRDEDYGPTAYYGYGITVDELDGDQLLRHTGGTVSFTSSMQVDISAGIGGFASVNADQKYRPEPVVKYAIQLMRAHVEGKEAAPAPAPDSELDIENAADYVGVFSGEQGQLEFVNEGKRVFLQRARDRIPLQRLANPNHFFVSAVEFERFPLVFRRKELSAARATNPIVEVSCGDAWYTTDGYNGPRQFQIPEEWRTYVGHYRNEHPLIGSVRVVVLKDRLMLDGVIPLEREGDLFRLRDSPANAEWIRFGELVNRKCMRLKYSGLDLWRVASA